MKNKELARNFKVYSIKLKNTDQEYFSRIFLEAKWLTNHILSSEDIFSYDTKINEVTVKTPDGESLREIKTLSAQMKQTILMEIKDNIRSLSKLKKKGAKVGRLKFKPFVNSIFISNQSFFIKGNKIRLSKHKKWFKAKGLDQLGKDPDIRCATIVRKPSGIYINICINKEITGKKPTIGNIGLDFGIENHFSFSDGTKVNFSSKDQINRIKKADRDLSRKKKGSRNRLKAKIKLQKEHEKLNNIKKDASNKLISALSNFKIAFQDEMISNWQKGFFGKQIQNTILGTVKSMLQKNTDNLVLKRSVPTTQFCRECKRLNRHKLSEREYHCECGYKNNRDTHSAINMLFFSGLEQASVERESDFQSILLRMQCKHLSVKQEAIN